MDRIRYPCRYLEVGCTEMPRGHDKFDHEELCIYRWCSCPFPIEGCQWQGGMLLAAHHLTHSHGLSVLHGDAVTFRSANINSAGDFHWVTLQSCFNSPFMLALIRRQTRHGVDWFYAAAQLLGSKRKAQGFKCRMELANGDKRLEWEGKPRCIYDKLNFPDIATGCLKFNMDTALLYVEKEALNIKVTITVLT